MRVLAVAQELTTPRRDRQLLRQGLAQALLEPGGDGRVVGRGAGERLGREAAAQRASVAPPWAPTASITVP